MRDNGKQRLRGKLPLYVCHSVCVCACARNCFNEKCGIAAYDSEDLKRVNILPIATVPLDSTEFGSCAITRV